MSSEEVQEATILTLIRVSTAANTVTLSIFVFRAAVARAGIIAACVPTRDSQYCMISTIVAERNMTRMMVNMKILVRELVMPW